MLSLTEFVSTLVNNTIQVKAYSNNTNCQQGLNHKVISWKPLMFLMQTKEKW